MTANAPSRAWSPKLPAYTVFAAFLAAGLPLYIHAPKYYVDEYGVSLVALGTVLGLLRMLDFVQDPLLARLASVMQGRRVLTVLIAAVTVFCAMFGLFAVTPPVAPLLWFAIMLTLIFSSFSYLTICFYAQGVSAAGHLPDQGHLRLTRWRETGALLGICAAAVAPIFLGGMAALLWPLPSLPAWPFGRCADNGAAPRSKIWALLALRRYCAIRWRADCLWWRWSMPRLSLSARPCSCSLSKAV